MQSSSVPIRLSGWGNYSRQLCHAAYPRTRDELREVICSASQRSWISRGLGRSYGDAAINGDAGVLVHDRLAAQVAFDERGGILECEAGISLGAVMEAVLPHGYVLPVTPGTQFVTLGGAIAADVHGKNHHRDGGFSSCVLDFELLTASGELLRCSRQEHSEIFWATVGGMGLTGAIVRARVQLRRVQTAYMRVEWLKSPDLDGALERLTETADQYSYSLSWIDGLARGRNLGRSVLMLGEHASIDDLSPAQNASPLTFKSRRRLRVPSIIPSLVLNRHSVRLFNATVYRLHKTGGELLDYETFSYPLDHVLGWNRLYGRSGFIQYQVLLPHAVARQGLIRLLESIASAGLGTYVAGMKTMGPASGGLLSFPSPGVTIGLDIPNRPGLFELTRRLDAMVLDFGGRLYLAKDATMQPNTFAAMYPKLGAFREIKHRVDPNSVFLSSQARRLRIVDGA